MNQTLEKAIDEARTFSLPEQEIVGQEMLALLEKRRIINQLDESDAQGGEIALNEVCDRLRSKLAQ